jgi:hypothetical protein
LGIWSFADNIQQGNYGWAALDAVGILADATALLLPLVPGGAGVAIKAMRAGGMAVDAAAATARTVRIANAASDVIKFADTGVNAFQAYEAYQQENYFGAALGAVGFGVRVGQVDLMSFRRFVPGGNGRWQLPSQYRTMQRREYRRFREQGYSQAGARRLLQPHRGTGHHFVQQAVFRPQIQRHGSSSIVGRVLETLRDNPLNLTRRRFMNTGRFYEYHSRMHLLPAFGKRSGSGFRLLPGEPWRASRVFDARPSFGRRGYLWFGTSVALKIAASEMMLGIAISTGEVRDAHSDE